MTRAPWAEVIGDPVTQSKSPAIHRFWLAGLGLPGAFHATRVTPARLPAFIAARRSEPGWRGCSVTIPHKQAVIAHLDGLAAAARSVGAVNCIHRDGDRLVGANTDVDGVMAAIDLHRATLRRPVLIGAGGAARAALAALRARGVKELAIVARDRAAAARLAGAFGLSARAFSLDESDRALAGADFVIQATPLGMQAMPPVPAVLLDALAGLAAGAVVFDMVYAPLETELLRRAGALSLRRVNGLVMLVGQARAAFRLLFGAEAPPDEAALMARLAP